MNKLKDILRLLLLVALFPVSCTVLVVPVWNHTEKSFIRDVTEDSPSAVVFPVLVTWKEPDASINCKVVLYSELKDFIANLDNYSFLAPPNQVERLNEILNNNLIAEIQKDGSSVYRTTSKPYSYVTIEHQDNEKQYLRVEFPTGHDSRDVGWYEAKDKEIFLKKHMSYGPGFAFLILPQVLFLSGLIWIAVFFGMRYLRARPAKIRFLLGAIGMHRFTVRLVVALITFIIGVAATLFFLVPQFRDSEQLSSQTPLMSAKTDRRIDCPLNKESLHVTVKSQINEKQKSAWTWSETRVDGREDLGAVQFINASEGWVSGNKGALYKTSDAGKTWQKVLIDVPPDSYINSMSFVSPAVGWIVASQEGKVFDDINSVRSWILNTTDGGKTWQKQYSDKALQVYKAKFINEQEGWAIGAKIPRAVQYVGFIIHTTDGGRHWAEVSDNGNKDEIGNTSAVVNIYAEQPSRALILKFSRKFYSTTDGGKSWREVAPLPDEPPQSLLGSSGFGVLGINRMWAAGGADSIEGMWGTIARMEDCEWKEYTIGAVYFADAIFLSDNNVLVCGTIPTPGHEMPRDDRDGLILDSQDGAGMWAVAYRSSHTRLGALAEADANNIWAVGSDGYIIHLQPSSEKPRQP